MSIRHIVGRIAAADVVLDPFRHLVIDDVDLHAEVVRGLPSFDMLLPLSESGARDLVACPHRASLALDEDAASLVSSAVLHAAGALAAPEVHKAIADLSTLGSFGTPH